MQSINKSSFLSVTCFQEDKREEVKEWVLAVSMDQKVGLNSFTPKSPRNYHHHNRFVRQREYKACFLVDLFNMGGPTMD